MVGVKVFVKVGVNAVVGEGVRVGVLVTVGVDDGVPIKLVLTLTSSNATS